MAPSPQGCSVEQEFQSLPSVPRPAPGDEVVISGLSGVFPGSSSVQKFMENLYDGVDMVTSENTRWEFDHPEVPQHLGLVDGMNKFDAQFFRVHYKQAVTLEPTCRKMLEHAYSALFDAGINPVELRGRKVGVFIGASTSESEKVVQYDTIQVDGFGITGTNKSMYANRISYWLDAKGPSYAIDAACASSMLTLEHAYRSIISGHCESAIVGGCSLCLQPFIQLNIKRIGFLTSDGKTKCFDKHADGYVRSDAISVLFLQKAKHAKRVYCEVYHAKTEFNDYTEDYKPVRNPDIVKNFLNNFYKEIDVSPQDVEYIEAFAPGIAEADRAELQAIGEVYCKGKATPQLVGSLKSNMGNSEPASGACSATKACLAYERGEIPANLHYDEPHGDVDVVRNGQVRVVTTTTPFNRGFIALNSFSYTGINVHVLLKGHYKEKNLDKYNAGIPYLITVSGRQESCVTNLLKTLSNNPIDPEAVGLLHSIHRKDISGHTCRGFTILDLNEQKETVTLGQGVEYTSVVNRPVWFVYSGMGSQWAGMGKDLMRLPIFANSIERCSKVLEPKGVDLINILTNPEKTIYDNILNSFVGIAAVQIGLTDVLTALGIVPDNIIGHSVGELGCAYADGCFTAEEMILSAYSRGLVSVQTPLIRGSMAAVGLGYKAVLPLLPAEIEVACHNSNESSTISGPAEIMKKFVAELTSRGIFAKEVPCSNIAYHSRYIADAGPNLLKYLSKIIKGTKPRSQKWLSTSVPFEKWNDPIAKYSSAEYHTNNLLNSVLFEETSKFIPSNAILIEVAPHGLLQAILKRSLPDTCVHVPLTRRGNTDGLKYFLDAVGKLYQNSLNPKVDCLYPKIEFPVSTGTPLLSQLVEWEHSENWTLATFNKKIKVKAASREFIISIHDFDNKYLVDHVREGLNKYPEAGILVRVWETLGLLLGVAYEDLSVTFHNVRFHNEVVLKREVPMIMNVEIHKGNQNFEVTCDDVRIASGSIFAQKKFFHRIYKDNEENHDKVNLTADDIYKMWEMKDHSYGKSFQSIRSSNITFSNALIKWDNEWTTFIDALIQLKALKRNHNGVSVPNFIQKLSIDTKKQYLNDKITRVDGIGCFDAKIYEVYSITRCGGVDVTGINFTDKPAIESKTDALAKHEFIPNFPTGTLDISTAISIHLQIVADNSLDDNVKLIEVTSHSSSILPIIENVAEKLPLQTKFTFSKLTSDRYDDDFDKTTDLSQCNLIVIDNLLGNQKKTISLYKKLQDNQFVMVRESGRTVESTYNLFDVVSAMNIGRETLVLLKKSITRGDNPLFMPIVQEFNYFWLSKALKELQRGKRLVIVAETRPIYGLLGIVKILRKEYRDKICFITIDDQKAPSFHQNVKLYKDQLNMNLCNNILKKGSWGGYYYLPAISTALLENVALSCAVPGDLDTLTWVEDTPEDNGNIVQVHYAGITLRDVSKASARICITDVTNQNKFGLDFSGLNSKGQRVMGIIEGGSISSNVASDPELTWPVPSHWSLEDAATVPFAYAQAFYCLMIRGQLSPGSSILVHGGAGALGQAAIAIALSYGCTVFTTVSNIRKKKLLLKLFPQLLENSIGCSRDNTFADIVMTATNGKGCDIIISCLYGFLQEVSVGCLCYRGVILLVNHLEMLENNPIGMSSLNSEHNLKAIRIDSIFKKDLIHQKKFLHKMISEGIANGTVRPLTRIVYNKTGVDRAFRLVGASRHCGRVLIGLQEAKSAVQSILKLSLNSQSCHVVSCDDQPLGIELADRLISRGARRILLQINPELVTGYLYTKMLSWEKIGVTLKLCSENLHTAKGCVNLLQAAIQMGSVEGIYATIPSKNSTFVRVERENVASQFNDKADIVLNLDTSSRQLCSELKYFVVLKPDNSFISNCMINDICQKRFDDGFPALTLQYQTQEKLALDVDNVVFADVKPHKISSVLNTMESSLRLELSAVVSHNVTRQMLNFKQKIARILGVKELEEIPEHLHLEQLVGVDYINIDEISNLVKMEFGIIYARETLEKATVAELLNIPANLSNAKKMRKLNGLDAFLGYVDHDEYLATEPIVPMHTMLSNSCDLIDEIDKSATYLMLIPGYEGHHRVFHKLCERLKIQAVTLQLQPDYDEEDVLQTADRIFQVIRKRFVLNSKFYLLGYSFGVLIALEVASLLEKEGFTGTVFCLDSSPDVLKTQLETYLGELDDKEKLKNSLILHMYRLMNGNDIEGLNEEIKDLNNWEDKVEACVVKLRNVVTYSNQYKRSLLKNAYKRIDQAINHVPSIEPLRSEIVLLRSVQGTDGLSKDYGLSKYSQKVVKVFDLEFDNASVAQDLRCSDIINCALDYDVLKEFKQNFTCDIYCADAENFF